MKFPLVVCLTVCAGLCASAAGDVSDNFYKAIRDDDAVALKALVAQRVDVNTKDKRGATPLMYAAAFGSMDSMQLLLSAGAGVNARNAFDVTPLMLGIYDFDKTALLVSKGADVNAKSKQGRTPVMLAAAYAGNLRTVQLLTEKGANLNTRDGLQNTALSVAADGAITALLLQKGCDPNTKSAAGFTPLMEAASSGDLEAVKLLLKKGGDVNARSEAAFGAGVKNGQIQLGLWTPLLLAVAYGSPELVKTLVDAGADVNAKDVRGMTPLMLAVGSDHNDPRVIRLLLDRGADPKIKSKDGDDTLAWAKKVGHADVLREFGIQPKAAHVEPVAVVHFEKQEVATAVQKSVDLLQKTTSTFLVQGGCASCHAHNLTTMAVAEARRKGIRIDEKAAEEHSKATAFGWAGFEQPMLQRLDPPGGSEMVAYAVLDLKAGNHPADRTTDAMIFDLAAMQRPDGSWHTGGVARPPMEDGDFGRTALSVHSMQLYGMRGRKAEFDSRIERAKQWLQASKPRTTEDHNMRLLGLSWTEADSKAVGRAVEEVRGLQRPDGGWAQTRDLHSDAYATGQALYALKTAGVAPNDPAYQRGAAYLLKTQLPDGSWHVASRAPKFQPYFQSGFPHDHDQWISSSATAWAVMALSAAIEPKQMAAVQ